MKLVITIILVGCIVGVVGFFAGYKWVSILSLLIVAELVVLLLASKKKKRSIKNNTRDKNGGK